MFSPSSRFARISRRYLSTVWPSRIPNQEFGDRRKNLLKDLGSALKSNEKRVLVIVKGAERSYIAPDVPHAFRQCSHFRYLTGVTSPGCYYVFSAEVADGGAATKTRRILFADRRSDVEELWEGKLPSDSVWEATAHFDDLLPSKQLLPVLEKLCDKQTAAFFDESANSMVSSIVKFKCSSVRALAPFVDSLRVAKSPHEIESMRDVCSLGAQTICATIAGCRNLSLENAIVGLLEFEGRSLLILPDPLGNRIYCILTGFRVFRWIEHTLNQLGYWREMQAYPPVVAAGGRANTIHYLDANNDIHPSDCVLMDAGCELNGYVSDITRCFPISGVWSDHQRSLYEALLYCHNELLNYANSMEKVRLSSLYSRMMELLAASMSELGLIEKGDNHAMIEATEKLCPHHVSHYLGMDVHDCPTVSRNIDLPPNVVFTVEPGVYVPMDWPRREWRGMGFRIEDDLATREGGGVELLSAAAPRTADQIQQLMNPSI